MAPRAYDPNAARLLRRGTLVYSLADIRRVIALRLSAGEPCSLELGADIDVQAGIEVPAGLVSFSLDGGNRFRLIVAGAVLTLFTCKASPTVFRDLSVLLKAGAVVTTAFVVVGTPTILQNVTVDATRGTLTNVWGLPDAGVSSKLIVETASFSSITNLFRIDSSTSTWLNSRVSDVTCTGVGAALVSLGQGGASAGFDFCRFERITGPLNVNLGPLTNQTVFDTVEGNNTTSVFDNSNSGNPVVLINVRKFPTITLTRNDVLLGAGPNRLNGGFATMARAFTLNVAAPTLTPSNTSFARMTHGASASGNVTIAAGVDGQRLVLFFASVAGSAVYTDGVGNLNLKGGTFTPIVNSTLELVYDATLAAWVEVTRNIPAGTFLRSTVLSASATHTTLSSTRKLFVRMAGGGGGGGGANTAATSGAVGGGGAGGGYLEATITATPSTGYVFTRGAGGLAGAAAAGTGGTGGNSTFVVGATTYTAPGGPGGGGMAGGTVAAVSAGGAAPGVGTNGDLNQGASMPGDVGIRFSATVLTSGDGGCSPLGQGTAGRPTQGVGSTATGNGGGGGAGGCCVNGGVAVAGGAGAPGLIIIDEFT